MQTLEFAGMALIIPFKLSNNFVFIFVILSEVWTGRRIYVNEAVCTGLFT